MGNNMGGSGISSNKAAKIMKINGEFFKLKIPSKVIDVTKDYPDHILLDSQDFLRFNLRAKPLSPEDELKPRKIYLLVKLPKFPYNKPNDIDFQSPLRRVRSGVLESTPTREIMMKKVTRRSISDLTIRSRSTGGIDSDNNGGGSFGGSHVGPTRVKMRLPKAQVEKIMEEGGDDDVEIAQRIVRLCFEENGAVSEGVAEMEERERGEEADVERQCKEHVHGMCSPCFSYRRKYKKLTH